MDRRELLKGIGVSAVGGAVLSGVPAEAALRSGPVPLSDKYEYPGVTGRIPVNKPRAHAVMEEMKVDGSSAAIPGRTRGGFQPFQSGTTRGAD